MNYGGAGKQGAGATTQNGNGSGNQDRRSWLHKADIAILLVGVLASLAAYFAVKNWEAKQQESRFVRLAGERCGSIEVELAHRMHGLRHIRRFFDESQSSGEKEFKDFVELMLVDHPEMSAVGWAPRLLDADRSRFEQVLRVDGPDDLRITDGPILNSSTVSPRREEYYPVLYQYPRTGWAMGCDLLSVPVQAEAVRRARDEGTTTIAGKVTLGPGQDNGVIFFEPIYARELPTTTVEERRAAIRGVILCPVLLDDVVQKALWRLDPEGIDIALFDISVPDDKRPLFQHWSRWRHGSETGFAVDDGSDLLYATSLSVADRTWQLQCTPSPEYTEAQVMWIPWVVLFGGICMTMVHVTYVRSKRRRTVLIEELVSERTAQLRESEARFRNLADSLPEVVFEADNKGRLLYVNKNAFDKFGYSQEDFHNGICALDLVIPEDRDRAAQTLEKIKRDGRTGAKEYTAMGKDGRTFPVIMHGRLKMRDGEPVGVRGIVIDITERKQTEGLLQVSYEIIKRSPAAAFIWQNRDGWPVEFASENVKRLFQYTAEDFMTGKIPYEKVIHPEDVERVLKEVKQHSRDNERKDFVHEPYRILTKDGQIRWMDDRTSIIRDEAGNITHYQGIVLDITERIEMENELKTTQEKLREESVALLKKNVALEQVLGHMEKDKLNYRQELAVHAEQLFMPIVEKLKKNGRCLSAKEVDLLEDAVKSILNKEIDVFKKNITRLTGRELEVCQMIRKDMASKEIADTLSISVDTVHKHRDSIRRKLEIKNLHVNLPTFLKSRPWPI